MVRIKDIASKANISNRKKSLPIYSQCLQTVKKKRSENWPPSLHKTSA